MLRTSRRGECRVVEQYRECDRVEWPRVRIESSEGLSRTMSTRPARKQGQDKDKAREGRGRSVSRLHYPTNTNATTYLRVTKSGWLESNHHYNYYFYSTLSGR